MGIPISDTNLQSYNKIEKRIISKEVKSFKFKYEHKPGLIKYFNIDLGKKYRINSEMRGIDKSIVEVLSFIYLKNSNVKIHQPIGVQVKFMKNNKIGTFYDLHQLVKVE